MSPPDGVDKALTLVENLAKVAPAVLVSSVDNTQGEVGVGLTLFEISMSPLN